MSIFNIAKEILFALIGHDQYKAGYRDGYKQAMKVLKNWWKEEQHELRK